MTLPGDTKDADPSYHHLERIDAICDEFERTWNERTSPSIEGFLDKCPDLPRPHLLFELICLERSLRHRAGETPEIDEYLRRFPNDKATVELVWREIPALSVAVAELTVLEPQIPSPEKKTGRSEQQELPARIGEFRILRQLGRGGMGIVYEAWQESLKKNVALKVLPQIGRCDQRQIQRFQNEASAAAQLEHENIVPVYSVGVDAGVHYYVMPVIHGHDLDHIIRHARSLVDSKVARLSGETPLLAGDETVIGQPTRIKENKPSLTGHSEISGVSYPSAGFVEMMAGKRSSMVVNDVFLSIVQIGIKAAEALHHAHLLGIVHRDIKPSNLMLDVHGKLWVTDFGLAQVQGAAALTMTGDVVGTLRYMSPEQPLGQRVLVDQRTDIYSLGVTLYELLTLRKAFDGQTPKEIIRQVCFDEPTAIHRLNPSVPDDLEIIVLKAMSRNPDDRYQTAQELADDLKRFSQDQPILARRPTLMQRSRRWIRRHLVLATSTAVAVVVLCLTSMAALPVILNSWTAEIVQRKRTESLLEKSEGLRLTALSLLELDRNPGLALALAIRGAELNPGVDANAAVLSAMRSNHELKTFSPRNEMSDKLSISPDGQMVVTTVSREFFGSGNYPAIESDLTTGRTMRTFDDGTAITSAAYSPDGRLLLTTSSPIRRPAAKDQEPVSDGNTNAAIAVPTLWNASTGARTISLNDASLDVVLGTEFSTDSQRVALPGRDNSVKIFSTATGELERSLQGHTSRVIAASFSSDGKRLVSTALDKTVRVWDLESGQELQKFEVGEFSRPEHTAVFVDSETVIISTNDGTRILSVDSGQQLNPQHWPESLSAVSRDGRRVAVLVPFGTDVAIRDTQSFRLNAEIHAGDFVVSVEFSNDGSRILVTTVSHATVYNCEDKGVVAHFHGHTGALRAGRFTPDDKNVITTAADGTVRCWSVQNGEQRLRLTEHPAKIDPSPWNFSDDSTFAVVATQPRWHSGLRDLAGRVSSIEFSGRMTRPSVNTRRLVTLDDHQVNVWHVPSSGRIASLALQSKTVIDAMPVPGTEIVVVVTDSAPTILWNTKTQGRMHVGEADNAAQCFDVHPSDGSIVLGLKNGDCLVVNSVTGAIRRSLPHDNAVLAAYFSPTGSMILTIDGTDTARVWSLDKDLPLQTFHDDSWRIEHGEFSSDESAIVTWNLDEKGSVTAWHIETGAIIAKTDAIVRPGVLIDPSQPIAAIASAKDGLILWNWETGQRRRLSDSPAKTPIFVGDDIVSIEAVPGFNDANSTLPEYGRRLEFARSVLMIRDVVTGEVVASQPLDSEPWSLALDQDTGQVLLSFSTHDVILVRIDDRQNLLPVGHHAAPIVFQAITGVTPKTICASLDGTVSIWDHSGRQLMPPLIHDHAVVNAAISPDGIRLATFDATGKGILWDVENGEKIMEFPGHAGIVPIIRFSGSGKRLLTSGSDSIIHIWDLISRTETQLTFEPGVISAEWSPDENRLLVLTGEVQNALKDKARPAGPLLPAATWLVELRTGTRSMVDAESLPHYGQFRPNGEQFAVISKVGKVTLYETTTGKAVTNFNPNRRPVSNIAFSPDGLDLLVMHNDELSLWDLDVGDEIVRISKADWSAVGSSLIRTPGVWNPFSPDGQWILSAWQHLEMWPRDPLKEALKQVPRQLSDVERQRFQVDLVKNGSNK